MTLFVCLQNASAPSGAITWLDREAPESTAGMITHAGPKSDDPLFCREPTKERVESNQSEEAMEREK